MTQPVGQKRAEYNPYAPPQAPLEPPAGPLPMETCIQKYDQLRFLYKIRYFSLVAGALVGGVGILGKNYAKHLLDSPPPFIEGRLTREKQWEIIEYVERVNEGHYIDDSTTPILYGMLPLVGLSELGRRWKIRSLTNEINQRCPDPRVMDFLTAVSAIQKHFVVLQLVPKGDAADAPQEEAPQESPQPAPQGSEFNSALGATVAGSVALLGLIWVVGNDLLPPGANDDHLIAPLWDRATIAFQAAYQLF